MRTPFTYIISSTDGHLYVGSKYGVDAHPSMLLKTYFTSSKYAKPLILQDPSKWSIVRLQEGATTEEVVAREMEWQLEHRHHKGLLNKTIDRANGKWVNYGPKSEETRRKMSESMKGRRNTPEVAKMIGDKTRGRKNTPETLALCSEKALKRWASTDEMRRNEIGQVISKTMKTNGTSVGANNSNTTTWVLRSPAGEVFEQPATMTGRDFVEGLGLSYQMLIKYRKNNEQFRGKLTGWSVVSCSRPSGQGQSRAGLRKL